MADQATAFRRQIVFSPCSEGGRNADHVGDSDMAERLRFGNGAPACLIRRATRRAISPVSPDNSQISLYSCGI
jgi:hypothetical protein